jgi:uncharacterized protein with HEPN domain
MFPSQHEFLKHIYEECIFLVDSSEGKTLDQIADDPILSRAIIRSLEIVGEASKQIHPDFTAKHPEVEWRQMAKMRDRLIHHYFGVDYEIVFTVLQSDIPALKHALENILNL